jgi:hypothetical protein
MIQLNIIGATTNAYKTLWQERRYIARLAGIPFLLRLFCFSIAVSYAGDSEQHLRFTLIMLPALLAEGWMVSHLSRLIVYGQRWPFTPSGNIEADLEILEVRARGILSGTIVFVLLNMLLGLLITFAAHFIIPYVPDDPTVSAADAEIPGHIVFLSISLLALMFWGFRIMWSYIPYAIAMDFRTFWMAFKGPYMSLSLIALWILCYVPMLLCLQLLAGGAAQLAQALGGDAGTSLVIVLVTVLADTLKSILTTFGMTFAMVEFFKKK